MPADRTPAEKLTAAAEKLDALIADVYPLPWYEAPVRLVPHRGIFDAKNREIATVYEESETPKVSALIVTLVNTVSPLAVLLRDEACDASGYTTPDEIERARQYWALMLDLARAILATKESAHA
jgi:hypothetical protein